MAPPILSLNSVSAHWGSEVIFENVTLGIGARDRLCLLGRNGSGKSTLMKVIAGSFQIDGGERYVNPGLRISFLQQEPDLSAFETVNDYVRAGLLVDDPNHYHQAEIAISELRLEGDQLCSVLSGGEARRAAIARAIVSEPDLLLLDEPTNHMDLTTIEWLENWLKSYRGAFVAISHDRAFLTHLTSACFWLDRGTVKRLDEGFGAFEDWMEAQTENEQVERAKLDKLIAKETEWSHKGISARRKRNQGRLRKLYDLRAQRASQRQQVGAANMQAGSGELSGKRVIEAKGVTKRFDGSDRSIIENFNCRILRGDRIGIIGPNGAGKTTLVRMLMGELSPDEGTIDLGTNLTPTVFEQNRASLDPDLTVKESVAGKNDHVHVLGKPKHVISYLKDYLFDESQLNQPVGSLSGGERNRLMLAKALAHPTNLLVLDEPTNDLDMETLDLLQELLTEYDGTLLLVSHDRDFLNRIVTSTLVLEGDGRVQEFPGGYDDYLEQRKEAAKKSQAAKPKTKTKESSPTKPKQQTKLSYKFERRGEELTKLIAKLEADIAQAETGLGQSGFFEKDGAGFNKLANKLEEMRATLVASEDEWMEIELMREELGQA